MAIFNSGPANAIWRHVVTFIGGAVTAGAVLGLVSQGDAQQIGDALKHLNTGFNEIIAALSILAPIGSAWYAAASATWKARTDSLKEGINKGQVTNLTVIGDPKPAK